MLMSTMCVLGYYRSVSVSYQPVSSWSNLIAEPNNVTRKWPMKISKVGELCFNCHLLLHVSLCCCFCCRRLVTQDMFLVVFTESIDVINVRKKN